MRGYVNRKKWDVFSESTFTIFILKYCLRCHDYNRSEVEYKVLY